MRLIIALYVFVLSILTIYSYGFVDPNLTLSTNPFYQKFHQPLFELIFNNRPLATYIFIFIIFLFTIFYLLFLWLGLKRKLNIKKVKWLIGLTVGVLIFSYPAFSYDIFNYILTAKVTFFYGENPYITMPIELIGDPNLLFTRAANKIALYGPSWIGLTAISHFLSFNNIVLAILMFKLLIVSFYLAAIILIYKISKSLFSVVLFALNPLVIIETLVNAHNDIVMMFLALLSFFFLSKKQLVWASIFLFLSILIKYATIFLVPIFLLTIFRILRKEKIIWNNVFYISAGSMLIVFFISIFREEIYPWYVIWILSFAVLVPKRKFLLLLSLTLSLSTLLRYVPVLYTGSYFGITPLIKELVTFIPLSFFILFWVFKKFIWRKIFSP